MNLMMMTKSLLAAACLLSTVRAESRPMIDQITERVILMERDFELVVRQFYRTVLGMDVHKSNILNQSPGASRTARADPSASNGIQVLPTAIPGMDMVTQLASSGVNPVAVMQQLFMGIIMQFQSILRTLTSLPGSEILGR